MQDCVFVQIAAEYVLKNRKGKNSMAENNIVEKCISKCNCISLLHYFMKNKDWLTEPYIAK